MPYPYLKKRADFVSLTKSARKVVRVGYILQVLRRKPTTSEGSEDARFGFTASRKIGNAVQRNRAKRRLRAIVEQVYKQKLAMSNCDYVLIARQSTLTVTFADLLRDFESELKKLNQTVKGQ